MGMSERTKGKVNERKLAAYLRDTFGLTARRTQQYRGMTDDASDIVAEELPSLFIECKCDKSVRLGTKRMQDVCAKAEHDAGESKTPVVFWRHDRTRQWHLTYRERAGWVTASDDETIANVLDTFRVMKEGAA